MNYLLSICPRIRTSSQASPPRPAEKQQILVTNPRSLHVRGSPERREGRAINQHGSAQHFAHGVLAWALGARAILQGLASASVRVAVRLAGRIDPQAMPRGARVEPSFCPSALSLL